VSGKEATPELLPGDLAAPQWVAHAGLDPRPYESGTSVHRPRCITKVGNRYLRGTLHARPGRHSTRAQRTTRISTATNSSDSLKKLLDRKESI